ncbi:Protein FAR1-like sequence 5 [Apostasia shenzhenica]|uniref:Protein FAR1-like sequence 5 n=1 Tax=Apostasia shenzhenica TaxID=1088818 RepID=A0A2I0AAU7_9ASPA|nr:Protein FAR1-like sequence 5 [Apostasia shenzhenica]
MKETASRENATSNASELSRQVEAQTCTFVSKEEKSTDGSFSQEVLNSPQSEPKVGLVFHSEEQAYNFYNSYAKRKGFSVRKGHLSRRKDGSIRDRHYLCSNEGTRQEHRTHVTKKPRALERTNCLARIEFKVSRDNIWTISKYIDEHNHLLASPNKIHMLRSHRAKVPPHRAFINESDYVGIKPVQTCALAEKLHDAESSVLLYKSQNYYLLQSNRTRDLEKGDLQFLLDFLKSKQSEDPTFCYAVQLDEKDRPTNFFWTDARSIFDYSCFGDSVLFDTTYRASSYDIPFAPFIGINHHKQVIIFGAALILDESMESFTWLFRTFLAAMSGKQPKTIFTDQCSALSRAISMSMPETFHQLCLWHVLVNAPKIVPHVFSREPSFEKDFEKCLFESCSEAELCKAWEHLISKYNLMNISWLEDLYAAREMWSYVYCKNSFNATMTTKEWRETVDNNFKMLFYRKLPPPKFMVQYHRALSHLREKEFSEDCESVLSKAVLLADIPTLMEAAELYTRVIYKDFEEEYKSQLACLCEPVGIEGNVYTFKVSIPHKRSLGLVEFDSSNVSVTCSCKKFELMGILCMHALKVLNYNNILQLPSRYILKRWTKYAKDGVTSSDRQPSSLDQGISDFSFSRVIRKAMTVVVKSAFSKDALNLVERMLDGCMAETESTVPNISSDKLDEVIMVNNVQQNAAEGNNHLF